jgi:ABC-2 type transport system permease protein
MELRLTSRRGENLLALLVIPAVVLLFFGAFLPPSQVPPVERLLPGTIALAIIAAGLVNLGIATAYERHYGVLKRLGGSPLSRGGLLAGKVAAILVAEAVQVALLVALAAVLFGWRPSPTASAPLLVAVILLGTLTFTGLGLLLAGTLRAEATLALANGLFLACLVLGGVIVPVDDLPSWLAAIARLLPAAALTDAVSVALGGPGQLGPAVVVLLVWAALATVVTARAFRWE